MGTRWCFPGLLKSSCHSLSKRRQDLPMAKAAALTWIGWHFVCLGFLAGMGSEAEVGSFSSKGPQVLRFPGVPEVEARFGCCPTHCLLSPNTPPSSMLLSRPKSLGSYLQMPRAMGAKAISLRGHLGAAYRSKDSPLKPELMVFWAQASCFSCPTSFRTDRF